MTKYAEQRKGSQSISLLRNPIQGLHASKSVMTDLIGTFKVPPIPRMGTMHTKLLSRAESDSRLYPSVMFNYDVTTFNDETNVQGEKRIT
jgi:hypothetical protein